MSKDLARNKKAFHDYADTYETKQILKEAVALIWISLIDNAARKSELDELNLIPNSLRQNAICLLNQKDTRACKRRWKRY